MTSKQVYSPGLAGVIAGETAIATVGKKGHGLMYRGYSITDLTNNCTFEEVAYLLTRGYLPNLTELQAYKAKISSRFELSPVIRRILELTPKTAHAMDVLKNVCSMLGSISPEQDMNDKNETLDIADTLLATFPSAIAYHYNYHWKNIVIDTKAQSNSDSIAYHFLRLLHLQNMKDCSCALDARMVKCLDVSLICYAEHGFAASTFAARVTTSTLSDSYSAICSAIGTLRGSLHGGANEKAFALISSFDSVNDARCSIREMLRKKIKIMGFGHRVYKSADPRSAILQKWSEKLQNGEYGKPKLVSIANAIQDTMWVEKKLFPNVDFPVAMAYHECGIPTKLFTPLFVCARTAGWMSHIMEQRAKNRIIRPTSIYVGPNLKEYVHLNQRKSKL